MASALTTVYLIRHGEVHNPRRILYGRLPGFRLSSNGLHQAREAGRALGKHRIDALFSSPLLRARQTAREIQRQTNHGDLHVSTFLHEVCTPYEGRPAEEVDAIDGDVYTGVPACFEQPGDVVARTRKLVWRLRKRYRGGKVAAVTHGDVITFMVLWARQMALTPGNKTRLMKAGFPVHYPAHASITTMVYHTLDPEERPKIDYLRPWSDPPEGG